MTDKTRVDGHPVYEIEDYLEKNKCNVVVAFRGWKPEHLCDLNKDSIMNLYVCDWEGHLAINEDNSIDEVFLDNNKEAFEKLRDDFEDETSRMAMDDFLHQKLTAVYEKRYSSNRQYFDLDLIELSEKEVLVY